MPTEFVQEQIRIGKPKGPSSSEGGPFLFVAVLTPEFVV
jgi:hypothetical protein